jgi:hypothetical protein
MRVTVGRRGRVECSARLELPLGAARAWGRLRDFRRFAAQDFFHTDVRVEGGIPRAGAALEIPHRFGPFRVTRVGRILSWEEGRGYAFSDLSRRSPRAAFPHAYRYELHPLADDRCRLGISIRGRWTLRLLPRPLVRLWLAWAFSHIVRSVENELLAAALPPRPPAAANAIPRQSVSQQTAELNEMSAATVRPADMTSGSP